MATPPWPDFDEMNKLETHAPKDATGIILGHGAKRFRRRRFLKDFKYIFMLFFGTPCGHAPLDPIFTKWTNLRPMPLRMPQA